MKYQVSYLDSTGAGLPFTEDITLEEKPANEEDLKKEFKRKLVKILGNIPNEENLTILDWIEI